MATNFPSALDSLANPAPGDALPGHAAQHANANDAIEALQARVGISGSADASSIEKRLVDAIAALSLPAWDDVFVIIGQSNADGRGAIGTDTSPPVPNVTMMDKGNVYRMAQEPIGEQVSGWVNNTPSEVNAGTPGHSFGVEMGKVAAHLAGVRSLLIPCAIGSTGFQHWLPPTTEDDMTTLYGAATARAKASQQRGRAPVFCLFGHEANSSDTTETLSTGAWTTRYVGKFTGLYSRLMAAFPGAHLLYAQLSAMNVGADASKHRLTGHAQLQSEDNGSAVAPVPAVLSSGTKLNENATNTVTVNADGSFLLAGDGTVALGYSLSGLTVGQQYMIEFTVTGTGAVKFMSGANEILTALSAGSPALYSVFFTAATPGTVLFYRNQNGFAVNCTIKILSILAMNTMPMARARVVVTHDVLRQASPNDIHLATAGYKEVGRRFALAYAEHVLKIPGIDGTGPRLVSVTSTDGTHTKVKFTQTIAAAKAGESNYSDGTNSLFRVYDGGTEKSVSSVAIDGADDTALIITHESCAGVRVITYGDRPGQNAAVRKGVVYNTATLPLPAPMFGPVVSV